MGRVAQVRGEDWYVHDWTDPWNSEKVCLDCVDSWLREWCSQPGVYPWDKSEAQAEFLRANVPADLDWRLYIKPASRAGGFPRWANKRSADGLHEAVRELERDRAPKKRAGSSRTSTVGTSITGASSFGTGNMGTGTTGTCTAPHGNRELPQAESAHADARPPASAPPRWDWEENGVLKGGFCTGFGWMYLYDTPNGEVMVHRHGDRSRHPEQNAPSSSAASQGAAGPSPGVLNQHLNAEGGNSSRALGWNAGSSVAARATSSERHPHSRAEAGAGGMYAAGCRMGSSALQRAAPLEQNRRGTAFLVEWIPRVDSANGQRSGAQAGLGAGARPDAWGRGYRADY